MDSWILPGDSKPEPNGSDVAATQVGDSHGGGNRALSWSLRNGECGAGGGNVLCDFTPPCVVT